MKKCLVLIELCIFSTHVSSIHFVFTYFVLTLFLFLMMVWQNLGESTPNHQTTVWPKYTLKL